MYKYGANVDSLAIEIQNLKLEISHLKLELEHLKKVQDGIIYQNNVQKLELRKTLFCYKALFCFLQLE